MSEEIQLIGDGEGFLVLGPIEAVDEFLESEGIQHSTLGPGRVASILRSGLAIAEALTTVAESSGRWVKLTKGSAEAMKKYGLIDAGTSGVQHAMVGKLGGVKQWVQVLSSPQSMASNPAILSGAAGVMAQLAMQQLVEEITDYLAAIDRKLDAVLRAQMNEVMARMDGVDLLLREAASVRESVGRVSEVSWSKLQHSSSVILETQAFALRQLADLAKNLEDASRIDDLADTAEHASREAAKWLNVLARCVQLHDSLAVIELDRVMSDSPDELDQHLVGLRAARQQRIELFARATESLLSRISSAVSRANSKVLLNPLRSPAVVRSSNEMAESLVTFREMLSIESERQSVEARRWLDAASEAWDTARESGIDGVDAVRTMSAGTLQQAKSVKQRLVGKAANRIRRGAGDEDDAPPR